MLVIPRKRRIFESEIEYIDYLSSLAEGMLKKKKRNRFKNDEEYAKYIGEFYDEVANLTFKLKKRAYNNSFKLSKKLKGRRNAKSIERIVKYKDSNKKEGCFHNLFSKIKGFFKKEENELAKEETDIKDEDIKIYNLDNDEEYATFIDKKLDKEEENSQEEIENSQEEIENSQEEIENSQEKIEKLEEKNGILQSENTKLIEQLKINGQEIKRLHDQNEFLTAELQRFKTEFYIYRFNINSEANQKAYEAALKENAMHDFIKSKENEEAYEAALVEDQCRSLEDRYPSLKTLREMGKLPKTLKK